MAKVAHSTPMLHVASIERTIAFYEKLGFRLIDDDGCRPVGWARMHCASGEIMFLRAEHKIEATKQGFFFYLYTPELEVLREELFMQGITASEIRHPPYMPSGAMSLIDPDGYRIEVGQWGEIEQAKWEQHLVNRATVLKMALRPGGGT
ncbi:MAG: VOC family protein [Edaphobacter sp.]|uniref:VOC family protein n=1 Tax=Edaphobacter sp. TaxID=1934404 RepID=UPI002390FEF4|nr:VOC family protein [Edaphobacter sp.]MDE1178718.1 VOC family protein [Edaphobacter sp.]